MQNNWYIIYTKPKWEKKVASALKKRKIENFLPLHFKQIISFRRIKTVEEPLFENYVFAKIAENEIFKLKNMDGVINLVYWKGEPAKIKHYEIEILRDFIRDNESITVEKTKINVFDSTRVIDDSRYSISGNVLTIKNTYTKINLPSLGFKLIAKVGLPDAIETETTFGQRQLLLQS